jgi:hypothetical protein
MKMRWVALAAALVVGGCAAQRVAQQRADLAQANGICRVQFPADIMLRIRCLNDALERIAPDDPLTPLAIATRLTLAEKEHDGTITHDEATAEYARTMYAAQQQLRQTQAAEASARAAAAAAILGAMPRPQPYYLPMPQVQPAPQPQYHNYTCIPMGNMVSCSGY